MSVELYVYWKVAEASLGAVASATAEAHRRLALAHPSLQARLLRRPEVREGLVTLMAVYQQPGGLTEGAQAAIDAALDRALAPWPSLSRHREVFSAVDAASAVPAGTVLN